MAYRSCGETSRRMRPANLSAYLFMVAGLGFLLPFISLSCSGQHLATVTGVQLVRGSEMSFHQTPFDARAAFALAMCVLGTLLSRTIAGTDRRIPALVGVAGTLALLAFKTTLDDEVLRHGHGVIRVQYEYGYYLSLGALVSATAVGFAARRARDL